MALRKNEALRTKQADDFAALWDGGVVEIYSGSQPADPDSGPSGTLLAIVDLPSPAFGAAVAGVVSKTSTWSGDTVGTATAGWARFKNAAATRSFDVTVAETGADLTIDDEDIVSGGIATVTAFSFTIPDGV